MTKETVEQPGKIICLCGSLRFKKQYGQVELYLVLQGNTVLTPCCMYVDAQRKDSFMEHKPRFDEQHLHKIDISDEVFVIDVDGYIGESTQKEIDHAKATGKPIRYMTKENLPLPKVELASLSPAPADKTDAIEGEKPPEDYHTAQFAAETYAMGKFNHHHDSEKWMIAFDAYMEGCVNDRQKFASALLDQAKANRRYESGVDKVGFIYISQLEELLKEGVSAKPDMGNPITPQSTLPSELSNVDDELFVKCKDCNGDGYTAEHDSLDPHIDGNCLACPIQVQCEKCKATGFVPASLRSSAKQGEVEDKAKAVK